MAAAGCLLYLRTLSFGLTYLDDQALVLGNQHFLGRWQSLLEAFRQDVFHVEHGGTAYYRPLFTVSLIVDAHLWGGWFGGYHLTNLAIHLAASCLLLAVLRRLAYPGRAALFFALAFAVSPALTQNVCNIPTRDDSLMGLFILASWAFFLDFARLGGWRRGLLHLMFFGLALFSKETAVVFIPLCLASLWLVDRGSRPPSEHALLAAGWGAVLLAWFLLRRAALDAPLPLGGGQMAVSIWKNLPAFVQLSGKVLLPFHLSGLPHLPDTPVVYGWATLAAVAAALSADRAWNGRRVAFGLAWFVAFMLPSMVLQSTTMANVVAEKRLYVPIVGFLLVLLETGFGRNLGSARGWALPVGAMALLVHAGAAFVYSGVYRDRMAFWRNAASSSPRLPLARRNLGVMLYLDGDIAGAEREYLAALSLNPVEPMVRNNLGLIYAGRGQLQEAERQYLLELRHYPDYVNTLHNLGLLYAGQGRVKESEELWKRALARNPDYPDLYVSLATLCFKQGRKGEAALYVERMRGMGMTVPAGLESLDRR